MEEPTGEVLAESPVHERAAASTRNRRFPCHQCGADLEWQPGVEALTCPYCGHREEAPEDERAIREYAFNDLVQLTGKAHSLGADVGEATCGGCGAVVELAPTVVIQECPFCGGSIKESARDADEIRPEAVLPFRIEGKEVERRLRQWIGSLWFAPSALRHEAVPERFQGVYRYWWTFDSDTRSWWSGQAGHYYYTGSGKDRRRHTRWVSRSGSYQAYCDDELVPGFRRGLETAGYHLDGLKPYEESALAGFIAERYEVAPQEGWALARSRIEARIAAECRRRLGGDTQRGFTCSTAHSAIACKGVLLPAWIGVYRWRGTVFRVTINGQNGAITAERPWSWIKITLAVLAGLAVILVVLAVSGEL